MSVTVVDSSAKCLEILQSYLEKSGNFIFPVGTLELGGINTLWVAESHSRGTGPHGGCASVLC